MKKFILKYPLAFFGVGVIISFCIAMLNHKVMFSPSTIDGFYSQMMHFQKGTESSYLYYVHMFRYFVAYPFLKTNTLYLGPIIQVLIISLLFIFPLLTIAPKIRHSKIDSNFKVLLVLALFTLFLPACILMISHRSTLCMIGTSFLYSAFFTVHSRRSFNLLIIFSLLLCNLSSGAVLSFIGTLIVFYKFIKNYTNAFYYIFVLMIAISSITISLYSKINYFQSSVECSNETEVNCTKYDQDFVEFYTSRSKFAESLQNNQIIQFAKFVSLLTLMLFIIVIEYIYPLNNFFSFKRIWSHNKGLFFLIGLPLAAVEGLGLMSYAYSGLIYLTTSSNYYRKILRF